MDLIAVIMAAPDTKTRFMEAAKLLNYGFANYSIYVDDNKDVAIEPVRVVKGAKDFVEGKVSKEFIYLCDKTKTSENIRKETVLYDKIEAPVKADDKIGEIVYYYNNNEKIGSVDILALTDVDKAGFMDCFTKILKRFFVAYR